MINLLVGNFDPHQFTKRLDAAFSEIRAAYPGNENCPLTGDRYIEFTHVIRYHLLQIAKACIFNGTNMFDVAREESVPHRTAQEEHDELTSIEDELERLFAPDVQRLQQLWVRLVTMDLFSEQDERVLAVVNEVEQRIMYDSIVYENTTIWTAASAPTDKDELIVRAEAIKRAENADDGIGVCIERRVNSTTGVNTFIAYAYNRRTNKEACKTDSAPATTCRAVQHALITLLRNEVEDCYDLNK